jgi:Fe2+ or Zn2+ uptake regulation protein
MKKGADKGEIVRRVAEFRKTCESRGLAVTHQREVIFRALLEMPEHPSPESLYEKVKKSIPSISLGTVYKNIKTFLDAGLIREVSLHHATLRVDVNTAPHHHLVCLRCKSIEDLDEQDLEPVKLKRKLTGFRPARFSVEVHGVCGTCAGQ